MDGYEAFLLTVRRDVNCLADGDRAVRRGAVVRLEKLLVSGGGAKAPSVEFACRLFLEELHKPLFRMFADQTEKCRELAIAMASHFVETVPLADLDNVLPLLLAALLGRLRTLPFPEQSEELRLELLRLLACLLNVGKDRLNPFAGDIVDALAKALTDTCPDAKRECCEIVKKVSAHFDAERVSRVGGSLIASLLGNLRHQQWKVRRATLDSLGSLLCLEAPMLDHMEDVLPHLNALLTDRTTAVRCCLAECLERWLLKGMSFKAPCVAIFDDDEGPLGFDKFEHRLLFLLLSVASDADTEQVAPGALGGLERLAAFKHEVRQRQAEKAREAAAATAAAAASRKRAGAGEEPGGAAAEAPADAYVVEVAPEFDYSSVHSLLPEPFASGCMPSALATTYVRLHLRTIIPQALGNLTQWTADIRNAAARLLRVVLVLVNRQIAPFLDQVLVYLYKASADDDQVVSQSTLQCAEMLGAFADVDLLLGLVAKHLGIKIETGGSAQANRAENIEELFPQNRQGRTVTRTVQDASTVGVKNFAALSAENKRQVIIVLAHLLRPAAPGASSRLQLVDVRTVLRFLEECTLSEELLPWALGTVRALLYAGGELCVSEWPRAFDLLLRMRSSEDCDAAAVDACMERLALLCGRPRLELYEEHLRSRLAELLAGADHELWEERSPRRHVIETLLRNSGAAAAPHLVVLAPVLSRQASPEDASVPARIDILGLVHFLVTQDEPAIAGTLREHAPLFLEGVLLPNCVWKAGQSNQKIRMAGMYCIHAMLQRKLLEPVALNSAFADLLPIVKSCLDDSWSPDTRMIACLVLTCMLSELQAELSSEQLREIYPDMLKRLDDSNDKIRAVVCEALCMFFKCLPPKWSRSLYEYILRTLFVHLDDPNPEIQQGIYGVLEAAVHQDYTTFAQEARTAIAKSSHPRTCEELLRLAESLQRASADADGGGGGHGEDGACMD